MRRKCNIIIHGLREPTNADSDDKISEDKVTVSNILTYELGLCENNVQILGT